MTYGDLWFGVGNTCQPALGADESVPTGRANSIEIFESIGAAPFFPSIGTSAVVASSPKTVDPDVRRVIALQNVYWALAASLSKTASGVINRVYRARRDRASLVILCQLSRLVVELHDRVACFRAILRDHVNNLTPQQLDCWEALAAAWRLESLLAELDIRRTDLQALHTGTLEQIQAEHAGRLTRVVVYLTTLSGASFGTGIIDYMFGGRLGPISGLRILWFGGVGLLLAAGLALSSGIRRRRDA